jgi:hypothetical protein
MGGRNTNAGAACAAVWRGGVSAGQPRKPHSCVAGRCKMPRELDLLPPPQTPQIVDNFLTKNTKPVHNFFHKIAHEKKRNEYS